MSRNTELADQLEQSVPQSHLSSVGESKNDK